MEAPRSPEVALVSKPRVVLKVCCVKSIDEARLAVRHGASVIGLVAKMPSGPGCIEDDQIKAISEWLSTEAPDVWSCMLTPLQDVNAIVELQRRLKPNTLQLVDCLTSGTHADLRKALPSVRIIQVLHVEDDRVVAEAAKLGPDEVDAILLDSGRPSLAIKELGGTGRVHDWKLSRAVVEAARVPVFLAGGLNPSNIVEAISQVGPYGVDICSGLRSGAGYDLDEEKLTSFVQKLSSL